MDRKTWVNIWYFVAAFIAFSLLQGLYQASKQYATIPYSQFETLLDQDKVDRVWIEQNTIQGTLKKAEKDGLKRFVTTRVTPDLAARLDQHHVTPLRRSPEHLAPGHSFLGPADAAAFLRGLDVRVIRRFGQAGRRRRAHGNRQEPCENLPSRKTPSVTFADVAGVEEAKDELKEIVDFLRDAKAYGRLGAHAFPRVSCWSTRLAPERLCWYARLRARRASILRDLRLGVRRDVRGRRRCAGARLVRASAKGSTGDHLHRRTRCPRRRPRLYPI